MTVQELIDQLIMVEDKTKPVHVQSLFGRDCFSVATEIQMTDVTEDDIEDEDDERDVPCVILFGDETFNDSGE